MISILLAIGLLITPIAYAQNDPDENTLYFKIKKLVEFEVNTSKAELAIEEFAAGVYYDQELQGVEDFEVEVDHVDMSIVKNIEDMCGTDPEIEIHQDFCSTSQTILKELVDRNNWHLALGRNLQAITSGYEVGIDGYPGKPVDAITRMTSIVHLWRASNDAYIQPFVEELTKAIPWPKKDQNGNDISDEIEKKLNEVVAKLKELKRTVGDKEDAIEMSAAIRRYRHGVKYVRTHEGSCANAPGSPSDLDRIWLEKRWCEIEDRLLEILDDLILPNVTIEEGNNEFILFPNFKDEESNIFIWIRKDDIGLQWYIPLEPVQAALFKPDYSDCLEQDTAKNCYERLSSSLVRGGLYPIKQDETGLRPGEAGLFTGSLNPTRPDPPDDEEYDQEEGAIMPEPHEKEGICSHPFAQRGYLCRPVESEACEIDENLKEELEEARKEEEQNEDEDEREGLVGGIILTRCQPEQFKGDVVRHVSGNDICAIGGWRETVPEHQVEDTIEKDQDLRPPYCAACTVDIVCEDDCGSGDATTSPIKHDGVIDICMSNKETPEKEYLMIHEMVHAQEVCNLSNIQALERLGHINGNGQDPEACCAVERTAYFAQCKAMAIDGILEKAQVSIDVCASVFSNYSCSGLDNDPNDEDYICSTGSINPADIRQKILDTMDEMVQEKTLNPIRTCEAAMNSPRVQAQKNSLPLACRPGCEARYTNTIGNNLCYTGQCIEESQEWSRPIAGRSPLTTIDQDFPWDSCEGEDPNIGEFEMPPAITAPKFAPYRPRYLLQQLDTALCQINGLPARTPPVICTFDVTNRIVLPPLTLLQSVQDIAQQTQTAATAGTGIRTAAQGIGARVVSDMFTQYLQTGAKNFSELLFMAQDVFRRISDIEFPSAMCPRFHDGRGLCSQLES